MTKQQRAALRKASTPEIRKRLRRLRENERRRAQRRR
jgi:hypothetical protein